MYQSSKRSASLCVKDIKKTVNEMGNSEKDIMDVSSSSSSSYHASQDESSINETEPKPTKENKAKPSVDDSIEEDDSEDGDVIDFSDLDDEDEDEDDDADVVDDDELSEEGREMLEGDEDDLDIEEENEDDKFRVIRPGELDDIDENGAMIAHDLEDDDDMCDHTGERMTLFYKHFMMTINYVVFHLCFSKLPELLIANDDPAKKQKSRAQYDGRPLYEYYAKAKQFFDLCERMANTVDSKMKNMTDKNPKIEIVYGIVKRVLGSHLVEAHPAVGIMAEDDVKGQNCATTGSSLEFNSKNPANPKEAWCVTIHTHKNKNAGGGTNEYPFLMSAQATKSLVALNYVAQFKRMLYNHASEQIYLYNTTPNLIVTDYAAKYLQTHSRWIDYHFTIFEEARKTICQTFEIHDPFVIIDE